MPCYHISSSGKLVKCKSDPCKLHAGTDFHKKLKSLPKMRLKTIILLNLLYQKILKNSPKTIIIIF